MNPDNRQTIIPALYRWVTPLWIVLLVLALYPFSKDPASPVKHLITSLAALPLAIGWLVGTWRGYWPAWPGAVCFFLLIVAGLCQNILWIPVILAAIALRPLLQDEALRGRIILAFIYAGGLASAYAMIQRLGIDPFPWAVTDTYEYLGLPATYGNPNFAGHVMAPLILIALGYLAARSERKDIIFFLGCAAVAFMALHLYLTGMRAAPLAMGAGVAVVIGFSALNTLIRKPQPLGYVFVTLGSLGAVAVLYCVYLFLVSRPDFLPPIDSAWILRLHGYHGAAAMVHDAPAPGIVPWMQVETFAERAPVYWTDFEDRWFSLYRKFNDHAHNDYLEIAVNGGWAALACFFFVLLWVLPQGLGRLGALRGRAFLLQAGLVAALVATLVDALFGFPWHLPVSFTLFVLLLLWMQPAPATPKKRRIIPLLIPLLVIAGAGWSLWDAAQRMAYNHLVFVAEAAETQAAENLHAGLRRDALLTAEGAFERARSIKPEAAPALRGLGRVSLSLGQSDRAVFFLERAYDANLNNPVTAGLLALAYLEQSTAAEDPLDRVVAGPMAGVAAEEALRLNPYLARPHEILGELAVREQRWEEAATHYQEAAIYDDDRRLDHLKAAVRAWLEADKPEAARPLLHAALNNAPIDAELFLLLPEVSPLDHADLIQRFEDLVEASSDSVSEALPILGDLALDAASDQREVDPEPFLAAVQKHPESLALMRLLDRAAGREALDQAIADAPPSEALDALRRIVNAHNADAEARQEIAAMIYAMQREPRVPNQVLPWLADFLHGPDIENTPGTRALLGTIYGMAEQWKDVITLTDAPLDGATPQQMAEALRFRAYALLAEDRPGDALQAARAAVAKSPDPRTRLVLAEALAANGMNDQAAFTYEGILNQTRVGSPEHTTATAGLNALEDPS
jgi:uncharacterized protein HemY